MQLFADPEERERKGWGDVDRGSWGESVDVDVEYEGKDVVGPSEEEFRGC